jgi:D-alanyl-D-alanine dipeptidase
MIALALVALLAVDPPLVDVAARIPDAVLDLRYATGRNFLRRPLYPAARCLLRAPVAERLERAAAALRRAGYRLRLFDCYRPLSVQREMWRAFPHAGYVADPSKGSNHNRGAAVDLSLAFADGRPVEMPTDFDAFEARAHVDATDGVSAEARKNRARLRDAMLGAGFTANRAEWWHFAAPESARYPLLDVGFDGSAETATRPER